MAFVVHQPAVESGAGESLIPIPRMFEVITIHGSSGGGVETRRGIVLERPSHVPVTCVPIFDGEFKLFSKFIDGVSELLIEEVVRVITVIPPFCKRSILCLVGQFGKPIQLDFF